MVFYVQPVSDLLPVAIDRQRLACLRVHDHQRDQFFGEVQGAVVVAAIGRHNRQAVGVVVGPYQVVAGGFAGAVGAVGLVGVGFCECRCVFGQ